MYVRILRIAALAAGLAGLVPVAQATTDQAGERPQPQPNLTGELKSPEADSLTIEQRQRREKCDYLWRKLYPWSYHPDLVDFFCGEHERAGLPEMWWESLVYGSSGSDMKPRMICRGGGMVSRGLMDCAWTFARDHRGRLEPLLSGSRAWGPDALFNPWVSIRCHVLEMGYYRRKSGREGWSLLRQVFLPASPDGGRTMREQRRWRRIEAEHQEALNVLWAQQAKQRPTLLSARP